MITYTSVSNVCECWYRVH